MTGRCNNCLDAEGVVRMWGAVHWCRQCAVDAGALGRRALVHHDYAKDPAKFTADVLRGLADGPIMDSNALYLPAGKLTMDEYRQREMRLLSGEPA